MFTQLAATGHPTETHSCQRRNMMESIFNAVSHQQITHTCTRAHTHTHARTPTHTRTHSLTRTHTHTHGQIHSQREINREDNLSISTVIYSSMKRELTVLEMSTDSSKSSIQ